MAFCDKTAEDVHLLDSTVMPTVVDYSSKGQGQADEQIQGSLQWWTVGLETEEQDEIWIAY